MLAVVSRVFDELTLAILQERDAAGDDPSRTWSPAVRDT